MHLQVTQGHTHRLLCPLNNNDMRAKELQIGDIVKCRDSIVRIHAITHNGIIYIDCERPYYFSEQYLEPIPLTKEILEKNGFVYNELPFIQGWERFGLVLYHAGNGYRVNCGTNVAMIIDSVHELQHALKLCGIDKTIEL